MTIRRHTSAASSASFAAILGAALILLVACGGQEETPGPAPTTGAVPTVVLPTPALPAVTPPAGMPALFNFCDPQEQNPPEYRLDVTARWKGKDEITIEGTVRLPRPGKLTYLICQDGQPFPFLRPARRPSVENGRISAVSKLLPQGEATFNPDARFDVFLAIVGRKFQTPMLIALIPVEGRPQ